MRSQRLPRRVSSAVAERSIGRRACCSAATAACSGCPVVSYLALLPALRRCMTTHQHAAAVCARGAMLRPAEVVPSKRTRAGKRAVPVFSALPGPLRPPAGARRHGREPGASPGELRDQPRHRRARSGAGACPCIADAAAPLTRGVSADAARQAWLPRGGALVAGPQSLNNAAQHCPALSGLRDWCAGARLPTNAGTALPVRAYITRVRPAAAECSGPAPQLTPRCARGASVFRAFLARRPIGPPPWSAFRRMTRAWSTAARAAEVRRGRSARAVSASEAQTEAAHAACLLPAYRTWFRGAHALTHLADATQCAPRWRCLFSGREATQATCPRLRCWRCCSATSA